MLKVECLFCLLAATFTLVFSTGDMGDGRWSILSIGECDEEALQDVDQICVIDVTRRKHNRTMEVYDATLNCEVDVDDSFGALIKVCKHVDGGCKEWQVLSDDSLPRFGQKYAEKNLQRALLMAEIDPPEFPILAGEHTITNYDLDLCEFPTDCVYGTFTATAYLIREGTKVSCLQTVVHFDEDTEGYDCD